MTITEKTGISVAVVAALLSASVFIASIYYSAAKNDEEIRILRQLYLETARENRSEMIRVETRLSILETKIDRLEDWCSKILKSMEKNAR